MRLTDPKEDDSEALDRACLRSEPEVQAHWLNRTPAHALPQTEHQRQSQARHQQLTSSIAASSPARLRPRG